MVTITRENDLVIIRGVERPKDLQINEKISICRFYPTTPLFAVFPVPPPKTTLPVGPAEESSYSLEEMKKLQNEEKNV